MAERCVCCGEIIPEGRQVCPNCENAPLREKLFDLIDEAAELYPSEVESIADHLIANGVTVADNNVGGKWIPVTERLPEVATRHKTYRQTFTKSVRVLCVCVQKDGKTMVKEGYCEFWDDYPEPYWKIPGTIDSVTHWMPLPEPPKGE